MRVAMYYNNRDVRVLDIPKPKIGPDELLIKVMACGICGSDVMEWYRLKRAPLVLGHEATGRIVEVGNKVKRYKVGERVFVLHHVPCNTCRYCLSGNHTVCETLQTTNYYPGGFSEYIRVPVLNVKCGVFPLPKGISFLDGTFIEPLACVLRGQRLVNLKPSQSVLIIGAGISGLLHLILAGQLGAKRVIVSDINNYRLKVAKQLGANAIFNANKDLVMRLRKANENRLADLVIVCTGAFSAFKQALKCVDRAGTILCFAPTEPGVRLPVPINDFWRQSIKIVHSYGNSPEDAVMAIKLIGKGELPLKKMITHRLPLKDAGKGFKLVAGARKCIKVIIEPHQNR